MISKVAIQAGLGVTAVGGMAGAITYALWDSSFEYLVEVKTVTTSTKTTTGGSSDNQITSKTQKKYFCKWGDSEIKDHNCKLIKLDFGSEKKSLNLEKIKTSNEEIDTTTAPTANIWLKLKISKDYEFKDKTPIEIKIVATGESETDFVTLTPKFKISTSTIEGNTGLVLVKLDKKTDQTISTTGNLKCKWITKAESAGYNGNWSSKTIDGAQDCKIYKFEAKTQPTLAGIDLNKQVNEFNLTSSGEITVSTLDSDIKQKTDKPYYIINFTDNKNAKSISDLIKKDNDLVAVVSVDSTNKPIATFTVEAPLTGKIDTTFANSHLILLN